MTTSSWCFASTRRDSSRCGSLARKSSDRTAHGRTGGPARQSYFAWTGIRDGRQLNRSKLGRAACPRVLILLLLFIPFLLFLFILLLLFCSETTRRIKSKR